MDSRPSRLIPPADHAADFTGGIERDGWPETSIKSGKTVVAIEVKSGRAPSALPGLSAFADAFKPKRSLLVGGDEISLEEFLTRPVEHWLG